MTRSIFEPGGEQPGRSGAGFLGTPGQAASKMPDSLTDGEVEEEMAADHEGEVEGLAEAARDAREKDRESESNDPDATEK